MQNTDTISKPVGYDNFNFKSEYYRTVYANIMRFRTSLTDLGIVFGVIEDMRGQIGKLGFKEEVAIILPFPSRVG